MSSQHHAAARPQCVGVHRIDCRGPGDLSGVQALIDAGTLVPADIVAVMGKTEGNGCVNDHTREYASMAWAHLLAPHLACTPAEAAQRVALVMSGGTEGVLSPHFNVFTRHRVPAGASRGKRLVVGTAHTRDFAPHELGRLTQVQATADAVRAAMIDAGIADAADVHFVQVKCPLLTAERIAEARARGADPATEDPYKSMGYSRGASALGVALALGEIAGPVPDAAVLHDWSLHSGVASASAGIELMHGVVIVLGNAAGGGGDLVIGHAVMQDALDLRAVYAAFGAAGISADRLPPHAVAPLAVVFAKAEAAPTGAIRGQRHTMLDDTDITATRHARAAVGGLLAGVCGSGLIYVSGGAEHQGPPGGGPVAVIHRLNGAAPTPSSSTSGDPS
jgi:cyanuric acid amidohydrolase